MKDATEKKIFYVDLLPVKLKKMLSNKKTQIVELKEFPLRNKDKYSIFLNFDENRQKQASFAKLGLLLPIEVLQKPTTKIEKFTTRFLGTDDNDKKDLIQLLFNSEIYLYAYLKDSKILQPLDTFVSLTQTQEKVPANISVNGIQFYNTFVRTRSKNDTTIKIGESMIIKLNNGEINVNLTESLRSISIDLDFVIQVMLAKSFTLDEFHISLKPVNFEDFNIEALKFSLNYYKKVVQILDYLNIKEDINISELTDIDERNFRTLITTFIDKKTISGLFPESPLVIMKILNFKLLLFFMPDKNNSDEVIIYDFFQMPNELVSIKDENGKYNLISQYIILKKDDYLEYSNTRYDSILSSFQRCYSDDNSTIIEGANKVLLDLLSVYDESKEKKSEVLCAAKELAEWLLEIHKTNTEIYQLNLLQTIKRERKFTKEENEILLSIALNNQNTEEILFGVNLLLDNQAVAAKYFKRLNFTTQEAYKQYPIYKFKKN